MKIRNDNNYPDELVRICSEGLYPRKPGRYSVTEILKSVREIMLNRLFYDEIEEDVSSRIWSLWGSGVHKIFESAQQDNVLREFKICVPVDTQKKKYELSGIIDKVDLNTKTIVDYKTTSKFAVKQPDWSNKGFLQMEIYAYMLHLLGIKIENVELHVYLRDWHNSDKFKGCENNVHIFKKPVHRMNLETIWRKYVLAKFELIKKYENATKEQADNLPACSDEDRWHTPDTFAVKAKNKKVALRVFEDEKEANRFIEMFNSDKYKPSDVYIEKRPGQDRKCEEYCSCSEFCSFYKNNK